jgi:hypothetical protein
LTEQPSSKQHGRKVWMKMSKMNRLDAWSDNSGFSAPRSAQGYFEGGAPVMGAGSSCGSSCGAGGGGKEQPKPSACGAGEEEKKQPKPDACSSPRGTGEKQ